MKMLKNVSSIILLPFLFLTCKKISPTVPAHIVFVAGEVNIVHEGKTQSGAVGKTVEPLDTIITGSKSATIIQIGDSIVARVGSNSHVMVKTLLDSSMDLSLEKGEIISKVQKLAKGQNYFVKTRTLVASVRGTEFLVRADEKLSKIAVHTGNIILDSPSEKVTEQSLPAGKAASAFSGISIETMSDKDITIEDISLKDKVKIEAFAKIETLPADVLSKPEQIEKQKSQYEKAIREVERFDSMSDVEIMSEIRREKIQKLLQKETRTLEEIKEVCDRIDVVRLYSGRIIQGAIIERGDNYKIMTTTGVIDVPKKDVRTVSIIR